ncbi:MAG: hypothetical protein Q8Q15_02165 [bacterium]|nr:hypothetical protein [bacterium]
MTKKEIKEKSVVTEAPEQEEILVIARKVLYPKGAHHGLRIENLEEIMEAINSHATFVPRFLEPDSDPTLLDTEHDPSLKQIIPYMVFVHNGQVFLMQRKDDHTEKRLAGQSTLGIGGHLRKNEFTDFHNYSSMAEAIFAWAKREFVEEVDYQGDFKVTVLGLINDDTAPVHAVHAGLALLIEGDSSEIKAKDEHKEGRMVSIDECAEDYDTLENWSKIVFETLKQNAKN